MSNESIVQPLTSTDAVQEISTSAAGRVSGKRWKLGKSATRHSHLPDGVKTKRWEERMEKQKRETAVKKLEAELKEEKQAEIRRRREVTQERKKVAEERQRLEEEKAKMSARKAARMRRKAGRTKKINH